MRKDIELHIDTYDVPIEAQNKYTLRDFRWVTNSTGLSRYLYGEIDIPAVVTEASVRKNGFAFSIPYTPKYQEFMVRVRRVYDNERYVYLQNQKDGSEWFAVKSKLYGNGDFENVMVSQLVQIADEDYFGMINEGHLELYAASQSDFNIVDANRQNANCMLACVPSNNYRYPLMGVGLVRWMHSGHIGSGDLARRLQSEFSADGVTVDNATYDYETQSITGLELNCTNTD